MRTITTLLLLLAVFACAEEPCEDREALLGMRMAVKTTTRHIDEIEYMLSQTDPAEPRYQELQDLLDNELQTKANLQAQIKNLYKTSDCLN